MTRQSESADETPAIAPPIGTSGPEKLTYFFADQDFNEVSTFGESG